MQLRNDSRGYGAVTKLLHWLTVAALAAQFLVGYRMATEADVADVDCDPPGEDISGGDLSDEEDDRLDRLEEECEAAQELLEDRADDLVGSAWDDLIAGNLSEAGLSLPEAHVLLGVAIIVLGVLRLGWRRAAPLPPWAPRLTTADRRAVHASETALLTLQFAVPVTGLLLVAGSDDLTWLHVAGHIAFFLALGAHLAMVLGRGLLPRMLPGARAARP
jgi:cytochrome b561